MAVDARTAIPAAVRLFGIVDFYDNLIFAFVLIKIRCHIDGERCIAIVMLTRLLSVDIDLGFLIHALEVKFDYLIAGCFECLTILALASLEPSSAGARSTFACIGTFEDVPVVRQIHGLRRSIMCKLPAEVKQLLFGHSRCRHHCDDQHHCYQNLFHIC